MKNAHLYGAVVVRSYAPYYRSGRNPLYVVRDAHRYSAVVVEIYVRDAHRYDAVVLEKCVPYYRSGLCTVCSAKRAPL